MTPVRKLITTNLQAIREKGLCYYYDEKYACGHHCRKQFNFLIIALEIPSVDDELNHLLEYLDLQVEPSPDPHSTLESLNAYISSHILMGQTAPQTLQVQGIISRSTATILVDSWSTHNLFQERVAKFFGLQLCQAQPFSVLVVGMSTGWIGYG